MIEAPNPPLAAQVAEEALLGANPAVAPMPPWVGSQESEEFVSNYVYLPGGIWRVPDEYVKRDYDQHIKITAEQWRDLSSEHHRLTAGTLLSGKTIQPEDVIVLSNLEDTSPSASPPRTHWFVRFSVHGGATCFRRKFGENFLWQLPHRMCNKILAAVSNYEEQENVAPAMRSPLCSQWAPTQHDFEPELWPQLKKITHLHNYYDRVFAMSVGPCAGPAAQLNENQIVCAEPIVRPPYMQPFYKCAVSDGDPPVTSGYDWEATPCDINNHVLGIVFQQALNSPNYSDWRAFLSMRMVSRSWRAAADAAGSKHFTNAVVSVGRALTTHRMNDIAAARDTVLRSGLSTIALLCDSKHITVYNLMRAKAQLRPGSMPPKPSILGVRDRDSTVGDLEAFLRSKIPCSRTAGYAVEFTG